MITYLQFEQLPLKKGQWSTEEDQALIAYINKNGIGKWTEMPKAAGLLRSGKSCRLRWMNYLRPDLKHGKFTKEEDEIILALHQQLGNRWSVIATKLPGRTDNEIKNRWHSHLKRRISTNFPGQKTSKPEIKERKSAENAAPCFTILDSSSDTKYNLFTSDSSSNSNTFGENGIVYSPGFYQYFDQYLQDQEKLENQKNNYSDYHMLVNDENSRNQSISPIGSSSSSNSTIWPHNWENSDQLLWQNEADYDLFEQVPNLREQQPFLVGEDYGNMDYI